MVQYIEKRDGSISPFNINNIINALKKAGKSGGDLLEHDAILLGNVIKNNLNRKYGTTVNIETVQDEVETALYNNGNPKTLRSYIVYREKRAAQRNVSQNMINVENAIDEYVNRADWRINANANQGYSLGGMILNVAGKVTANYWLNQIYPKEIGQAHRNGDIHIHDLDMLSIYCCGWSLKNVLREGMNGIPGKIESNPPKHFGSALNQAMNHLCCCQNEAAGAQAYSSFDTYMAPYIRLDNLSYREVEQQLQEFIYNLNVPSRWGTQTPFTNLTFDWVCPEDLRGEYPIVGVEECDFTYGDLQKEMDMINKAYISIMLKGDRNGRVFTFPIPTYNITKDFNWNSENATLLFQMTAKYGLPYFQNFVNSELKPNMIRSMCCRLQLDLRELLKRGNGLFGSAEQTGSIGVVTINCARLGYLYKGNEEGLFNRLDYLMELARDSLELKRKTIQQNMDRGLYPYIRRWLGTLKNHFSTIGVNGINEMIRNFTNDEHDITDEWGHAFAVKFMDHIREKLVTFQVEGGTMFNLEATPAEGCFTRETEVYTIDGPIQIKDLVRKEVPVLSRNASGKLEFKKATNIHCTGYKRLVKVTFDNGLEIKCTENHPFAYRHWDGQNGERLAWITAGELVSGDRIYSHYLGHKDSGYVMIGSGHQYLHKTIWEYYNGNIPEGHVIHHIDGNKDHNNIENLQLMTESDHKSHHIRELQKQGKCIAGYGEDNPFYGKSHSFESKLAIRATKTGLAYEQDKEIVKLHNDGLSNAQIGRLLKINRDVVRKCLNFYSNNTDLEIKKFETSKFPPFNGAAIEYLLTKGLTVAEISGVLGGHNTIEAVSDYVKYLEVPNHTVESVEFLDEVVPVYNMEVEDNHNYYVGNMEQGFVLVHNCTYRFAKEDLKRFPDILQAGTVNNPYYTNSSQLPVGYTDDPFEALEMQDDLQRKYTGGTVLHLYMNEAISNSESCKRIVKTALTNFRLPYITISPTFSICPKHGYIAGEHKYCPKCDEELIHQYSIKNNSL